MTSFFNKNRSCNCLQTFNRYSSHYFEIIVILSRFRSSLFRSLFLMPFFKYPPIMKNSPTCPPGNFKFGSGYLWNLIPWRNILTNVHRIYQVCSQIPLAHYTTFIKVDWKFWHKFLKFVKLLEMVHQLIQHFQKLNFLVLRIRKSSLWHTCFGECFSKCY